MRELSHENKHLEGLINLEAANRKNPHLQEKGLQRLQKYVDEQVLGRNAAHKVEKRRSNKAVFVKGAQQE